MKKLKGTQDIIEDMNNVKYLEKLINDISFLYNYKEIRTPIIEHSEVFKRGVGDSTDIINKEMYEFYDKGKRLISLRPEGTAPIVRAFIENKLYSDNLNKKYFYLGPLFRYERPQKGRLRQFNQFGIENFGNDNTKNDIEVISIMYNLLKLIGIDKIKVKLNHLGNKDIIDKYKNLLKDYFKNNLDELCEDCKRRFDKNVLRLLDCKVDKNNDIIKNIPKIDEFYDLETKKRLDDLFVGLDSLEIDYIYDNNLVRGLDYYTGIVFEIVYYGDSLGTQDVLVGGGQYNDLVEQMGGPNTCAFGAAMGIERVLLIIKEEIVLPIDNTIDVFLISIGEEVNSKSVEILNLLRMNGYSTETCYEQKSIKSQFKMANRYNPKSIIVFGNDELNKGIVKIKINNIEKEVDLNEIIYYLDSEVNNKNV